jgi:hypothetical protein
MIPLRGLHENVQCNAEFVYQLSIFSRTEENHGKLDRVDRSQGLSGANWLLASSPAVTDWQNPKLLLAFASIVILGSEFHGTHDNILLCHDSRSLQTSVPIRQLQIMQIIYKYSVRTSQETHYVSATKPNRLMLFGETVALYCVRTIRTTKIHFQIIYKNSVRTSQETHYVSATKTNRLMRFKETVAVYCENHTEYNKYTVWSECKDLIC